MSLGVEVDVIVFSALSVLALVLAVAVARTIRRMDRQAREAQAARAIEAKVTAEAWTRFLRDHGLVDPEVRDEI